MIIKKIFDKKNWQEFFHHLILFIKDIPEYLKFFILLFIYLYKKINHIVAKIPIVGKFIGKILEKFGKIAGKPIEKFVYKINACYPDVKTRRMFLIDLAYKNLMMKKTRTLITILGMSVGIGVIVFLISLGYGIERLIINQVATLDETKMIDVFTGENTTNKLDQKIYAKIKSLKNVQDAIPVVSLVGKLTYQKASTDVIVYATPKKFFDFSRFKLLKGKFYSDNSGFDGKSLSKKNGDVQGAFSQLKTKVKIYTPVSQEIISFNILPQERVGIWEKCDIKSQFLGYATRLEKGYLGLQYYGSSFYPFSENGLVGIDEKTQVMVGLWIKSKFPLFQISGFEDKEILTPVLNKEGQQEWVEGCIPNYKVKVEEKTAIAGEVLGIATGSAQTEGQTATASSDLVSPAEKNATGSALLLGDLEVVASSAGGIEIVSLKASDSATTKKKVIEFKEPVSGEAVVSLALLNLLNIPVDRALKTDFNLSLVVVKSLIPEIEGKATTEPVKYKVIGVIDDDQNSYLYVPFADLYRLAVRNLSQLKIVLSDQKDLPLVRKEVETMGFKTASVTDTIKQIEALFANVRLVLAMIGLVALVVAALGMFNTLTVSLLERTREIGGMKVMGVVAHEIEDLFLAEAMIMGLGGGFGGLIFGFLAGKLLSFIVTVIAFSSQRQILDLTYIPLPFIIFIIILSFFVGIVTGLYPAQRAKKISALNALRYE